MSALFAPVLPAGAQLFDPQVIYDHYAGRWVVVVAARPPHPINGAKTRASADRFMFSVRSLRVSGGASSGGRH